MQEKRRLVARTWKRASHFVTAFELDAYGRRAALEQGYETNIYFVCELARGGAWKVGRAENPISRFSQMQVNNPRDLALFTAAPATTALEKYVHHVLRRERIRGEWFRPGQRTLALAELFLSAGEICADALRVDDDPIDSSFTIACLVSRVEDALYWRSQAAA